MKDEFSLSSIIRIPIPIPIKKPNTSLLSSSLNISILMTMKYNYGHVWYAGFIWVLDLTKATQVFVCSKDGWCKGFYNNAKPYIVLYVYFFVLSILFII